jgi:hypothetical protein
MSSTPTRRLGLTSLAKKLAPYFIALIVLGWTLHRTDMTKLLDALRHAPLGWFLAVAVVMIIITCAADTFAMSAVFARFGCHVPYKDLYLVRASTYLLAVLNYHVGQAAIVGYLYRIKRVPLLRASGWILFIIGINVGTLILLASAGTTRMTGELAFVRYLPVAGAAGIIAYGAILLGKPRILADRRILKPLFEMGIRGHVMGVLVRLPHIAVLLLWHYVSMRMFNVHVTLGAALLYLPVYFAVQSLPINVNGLGAAQPVAVFFFAPYAAIPADVNDPVGAAKAAVMAYSLATSVVSMVLQCILGAIALRWATARGLKPEPMEAEPDVNTTAASAVAVE